MAAKAAAKIIVLERMSVTVLTQRHAHGRCRLQIIRMRGAVTLGLHPGDG
jgi:hypothetical protein